MKKKTNPNQSLLAFATMLLLLQCPAAPAIAQTNTDGAAEAAKNVITVQSETQAVTLPDNGPCNEDLLKGYVQQLFDESLGRADKARHKSAKENLSGNDLILYQALKDEIEKIAKGERTSTEISFSVSDLKVLGMDTGPWTAADLGVSDIVKDGQYTSEAYSAVSKKLSFDGSRIISALLADCPYELYWYEKTAQSSWTYLGYSASYSDDEWKTEAVGEIKFSFPVATEYSSADYTVNSGLIASVNSSIDNAKAIVENNKAKTLLERLEAYRAKICELVSYNSAAAAGGVAYGNPWQLVWVFDGNPETNVVCEGYSKAFKYLCDLSGFSDVECIIATGTMAGGTGAGGHMWNIIRMDDGNNYLVDVTNCDAGTIGADTELFMAYGPTGTWDNYTFTVKSQNITYIYDDKTKRSFGQAALTLSTSGYTSTITLDLAGDIATQLEAYKGQTVNIGFERTGLTASSPITICLPYAYKVKASDGKYYTFTGVSKGDDDKWTATMTEFTGEYLTANTPYLLVPSGASVDFSGTYTLPASVSAGSTTTGDSKWTFKGVYAKKTWTAAGNDYGFAANDGTSADGKGTAVKAGDFVRVGSGASLDPLRCFLTYNTGGGARKKASPADPLPNSIRVLLVSSKGSVTSIGEIKTGSEDDVWYTLDGRKLTGQPTKNGLYINNGKKAIVK